MVCLKEPIYKAGPLCYTSTVIQTVHQGSSSPLWRRERGRAFNKAE
jgi:hypothetical protein